MYLLMLLATFLASIYGYNLSIRPDYDRDVMRKKAEAVIARFIQHHLTVYRFANESRFNGLAKDNFMNYLPGDIFFAQVDSEGDVSLFLKQPTIGDDVVNLFEKRVEYFKDIDEEFRVGYETLDSVSKKEFKNSLVVMGRHLMSKSVIDNALEGTMSETYTMLVCPNEKIYNNSSTLAQCTPKYDSCLEFEDDGETCKTYDTSSGVSKTCCRTAYAISYRRVDARLKNKVTGGISHDFVNALRKHKYSENIGVISWNESLGAWEFEGKIRDEIVYGKDRDEWLAEQEDSEAIYPLSLSERGYWLLQNNLFKRDFFVDADGHNVCEAGGCMLKLTTL